MIDCTKGYTIGEFLEFARKSLQLLGFGFRDEQVSGFEFRAERGFGSRAQNV